MSKLDNNPLYVLFFIFVVASYTFSSFAFIFPHWYAIWPTASSDFERIGLWEICFDRFMQEDIYNKLFVGCFYLENPLISELYGWFMRGWLNGARFLFTLNYLAMMLLTFFSFALIIKLFNINSKKNGLILLILLIIAGVSCLITLIVFGAATHNLQPNEWMPNPEQTTLSWSYGSAALNLLGVLICLIIISVAMSKSRGYSKLIWSLGDVKRTINELESEQPLNSHLDTATYSPGVRKPSIYDPRGSQGDNIDNAHSMSILSEEQQSNSKHNNPQTLSQINSSVLSTPRDVDPYPKKHHKAPVSALALNPVKKPHHQSGSDLNKPYQEATSPGTSQLVSSSTMQQTSNLGRARPPVPALAQQSQVVLTAKPMKRK